MQGQVSERTRTETFMETDMEKGDVLDPSKDQDETDHQEITYTGGTVLESAISLTSMSQVQPLARNPHSGIARNTSKSTLERRLSAGADKR